MNPEIRSPRLAGCKYKHYKKTQIKTIKKQKAGTPTMYDYQDKIDLFQLKEDKGREMDNKTYTWWGCQALLSTSPEKKIPKYEGYKRTYEDCKLI